MKRVKNTPFTSRILATLLASSAVSIVLLLARMMVTGSTLFSFMAWNLFLAWLPLVFALGFRLSLPKRPLLSGQNIFLLVLWLGFLPNSFYIMSDLIHLQLVSESTLLFDAAMMMSFIINGLIVGYLSVFIVHKQLLKRLRPRLVSRFLVLVFLCCGFAIYLGRYLRWNTWDILVNPAGLLFDISERVVNPLLHIQTFIITAVFFILLGSTYAIVYQLFNVFQAQDG